MKPAPFRYQLAASLPDALSALAEAGPEAKLLAGGQSLMPMANFRLLRPSVLIDINRITELGAVAEHAGGISIGALTRHAAIETTPLIARAHPILPHAMGFVAHPTIRNRGTIGGSLAHNDPAAEWPMLALLLDAVLTLASRAGTRSLKARQFLTGPLATALAPDEMLTAIDLPAPLPGTGWGFAELARRHGDFALAAVGVTLRAETGRVTDARIALTGVGDTALRAGAAEAILDGRRPDEATLAAAVAAIRDALRPMTDLHASADYRRHLAGVLAARAIRDAWRRAGGSA
jgi:CO/xanthine dehydrogenase FAD-binding subunit